MKVEILSPAGSMESLHAAIKAGADAVYAGGTRFSARASAANFTEAELLQGIDYAHIHGRKFYLAVNTLLKQREMGELYDYLAPLYEQGLDAVIVQDVGVLQFIKEYFPLLDIHASTQMTITNVKGALFLANQGVKRVVPARELSFDEVREMSKQSGIEVECFVHGALCYSYSGQCLLSSVIGGRSGNRGQCAQPCRLWYENQDEKGYLLSLKDICTLSLLPQLIDAGIASFKIEGRMKKPEYVALTTALYKKYRDLYYVNGLKGYQVSEQDQEMLLDLYNRGGFHRGYYTQHHGVDMIVKERPNHAGVPAILTQGQKGRELSGVALTHIYKRDVIELTKKGGNYTFGKEMKKGNTATIMLPSNQKIEIGRTLYRFRNHKLIEEIQATYLQSKNTISIHGHLLLEPLQPARLRAWIGEQGSSRNNETKNCKKYEVQVLSTNNVELAKTRALDREKIIKQLMKTGNTEFVFEQLEVELTGNVFLPLQQINELRRRALDELRNTILAGQRREITSIKGEEHQHESYEEVVKADSEYPVNLLTEKGFFTSLEVGRENPLVSVSVETMAQLQAVFEITGVDRIYFHESLRKEVVQLIPSLKEKGIEVFVAMPHIFRQSTNNKGISFAHCIISQEASSIELTQYERDLYDILDKGADGILVRNFESIQFLKERKFDKSIVLDHNLYTFNPSARKFWQELSLRSFTAPLELRYEELKELGVWDMEMLIYGRIPVMISAQCIHQNTKSCRKNEVSWLTDRKQMKFPVKNFCDFCYNVMYNAVPLSLFGHLQIIRDLKPAGLRLAFTIESKEETTMVLQKFLKQDKEPPASFTTGHFRRGVV